MSKRLYDIIDEKELKQLYCVDNKSTVEIAKQYGCEYRTIIKALRNYDIAIKHQAWESRINKNNLQQMYNVKNKSIRDIARTYGTSASTVKHYLLKYNIPLRTSVEGRKIFLTKDIPINNDFLEILNGLLLGDGNIQVPNNFQGIYSQASSQKEFIDYVANIFKKNNYYQDNGEYKAHIKNISKEYPVYYLHSKRTLQLRDVFNRWYPDGKKHVPQDIKLTPKTVLFWYLSDGSKDKYCKTSYFSTCAFSIYEQNILIDAFRKVGINADNFKQNKYYVMRVSKSNNFDNFMHYMGINPVSCYDYKFSSEFRSIVRACV